MSTKMAAEEEEAQEGSDRELASLKHAIVLSGHELNGGAMKTYQEKSHQACEHSSAVS